MTSCQFILLISLFSGLAGCASSGSFEANQQECRDQVSKHGETLRICETNERVTVEDVGQQASPAAPPDHPPPPRLIGDPNALDVLARLSRPNAVLAPAAGGDSCHSDDRIVVSLTPRQLNELLASR